MKVSVVLEHKVDPELIDYLDRIETAAQKEVFNTQIVLSNIDMLELSNDIMKLAREEEKLIKITKQVGFPWMARDIIEHRAYIQEDMIKYYPQYEPRTIKEKLEKIVGPLSNQQFKEVMEITTSVVKVNIIGHGHIADIDSVIKIAAQCSEILNRCSGKI